MRKLAAVALATAFTATGCQTTGLGGPLPDGVSLVERVQKRGDDIVIPYSKYELDNGLTVILHEDDSDPLVHVDVTYHVGSGREDPGKSGFAHFFEHMMFQGSENVGDEQHFRIVQESGGTLNGTTNTDRTNYFETVPANQLEKMIWLEADRMGFLLPAVTQEKFEVQRETVKNERGQNYDNRPYGLLRERVNEALFPEGHPYSWLTIGYIEDLNRADLNDLKKFFLRWYGPNNATLTIGGDLDKRQTLEWVVKYFGSIPRGPDVADPVFEPVSLDADRYISMEDNVALPLVQIVWPTVHRFHPDEAPLDVLMSIMGTGRTSLLYKNLVKDGDAVQATAGHGCQELSCQFTLTALPNPASGKSLAELERVMRESLVEFEARGVQNDDLIRTKQNIVSGIIFGLESVSGKVSNLANFATFADTPNYTAEEIARYERVTKDDVMRVYEQYVKGKHAVVISIVPNGQGDAIAREDTWERYERTIPDNATVTEAGLELREPVDDFDRTAEPPASDDNPAITLPRIWHASLDNGIEVLGAVNDETPTSAVAIRIEAGQRHEPLAKLGLASLTAQMINEATESSTNEDLSNRLQKLGSSISVNSDDRFTTVIVRSLSENLAETLEIAAERILTPKFDQADFDRLKSQTLQGIEQSKTQASTTASEVFETLVYGRDNNFAHPDVGRAETVTEISLDDVKAFYDEHFTGGAAAIIAVSDVSRADMLDALSVLGAWGGVAAPALDAKPLPDLAAGTLYLVDKPGAAQSEIRIGVRAMPYDAFDAYYRSSLMNFALGGSFSSRINLNLREDKGYTYGARAFFNGDDKYGWYRAQAGVRTDATAASIVEFVMEITDYAAEGITPQELAFTKRAIGQADARRYETPFQKLSILGNIVTYDLPDDFITRQNEILAAIEKPEIDALASAHLPIDDMILVVVGDKSVILDGLQGLGYPIVELDADGERL